jgi:hypothetical protein
MTAHRPPRSIRQCKGRVLQDDTASQEATARCRAHFCQSAPVTICQTRRAGSAFKQRRVGDHRKRALLAHRGWFAFAEGTAAADRPSTCGRSRKPAPSISSFFRARRGVPASLLIGRSRAQPCAAARWPSRLAASRRGGLCVCRVAAVRRVSIPVRRRDLSGVADSGRAQGKALETPVPVNDERRHKSAREL